MFGFRKKNALPTADEILPGRDQPIATAAEHFVNHAALKGPYPEGSDIAYFGLGCFWGAERKFWQTPGVIVTAVGYAGGQTPNATYEEVCSGLTGHNEVVKVVFDPARVSYEQLLNLDPSRWRPRQRLLITVGISFIFAFLLAYNAVQVGIGSLLLNDFVSKTPAMALAVGGITGLAFAAVQDIIYRVKPTVK